MAVICAGAKSILDIPRTLEVLVSESTLSQLTMVGNARGLCRHLRREPRLSSLLYAELRHEGKILKLLVAEDSRAPGRSDS
jgi:hypothetical protein